MPKIIIKDAFPKLVLKPKPKFKNQIHIMSNLYILHHLGLGDHIICNGMIRYLYKKLQQPIVLVVKQRNLNNVKRMYCDCTWLSFITSEDFSKLDKKLINHKHIRLEKTFGKRQFDQSFYLFADVPFKERWDSFFIERDRIQENILYNSLNLPNKFILCSNECSNKKFDIYLNTNLPIIYVRKLDIEKSFFDWMSVIESAQEIHCIDSASIHLVESMTNITNLLYYHNIRKNGTGFTRRKPWKII
jgi:hypothetical protein